MLKIKFLILLLCIGCSLVQNPDDIKPCEPIACDSIIVQLILDKNGIDKTVGDVAGRVSPGRVVILQLASLGVTVIPPEIGKLDKLIFLDIENNKVKLLPEQFGDLNNLSLLQMNNNQLSDLPKSILKLDLDSLPITEINYNRLCDLSSDIEAWIDFHSVDSLWRDSQICD